MSVYRQQAFISSPNAICIGKMDKTELFKQKSGAIRAYPNSANRQVVFVPKRSPANDTTVKSLEVSEQQSKFINDTMRDIRQKESIDRGSKKIKIHSKYPVENTSFSGNEHESLVASGIEILDEMELHADIGQFVATSGGLIISWNDAFLYVVKPTTSMSAIPLTIFDLVEPESLQKLYRMLGLALNEEVIMKEEASMNVEENNTVAPSHMSIILPTKKFRHTNIRYEITIVFTEHILLRERSFLGWIKPAPTFSSTTSISKFVNVSSDNEFRLNEERSRRNLLPRGVILRLENTALRQLLYDEEH